MAQPAYRVFHRLIDGKPALALIDETANQNSRRLPECVIAWAQFGERDESGLPNEKALEQLHALDEQIEQNARKLGAVVAAALTSDGKRTWLIYAAKSEPVLRAIGAAAKAAGPMGHGLGLNVPTGLGVRSQRDPEWKLFEEMLPTPEERRWSDDLMVVEELEENGDILTEPREIEHLALLPSEAARERFSEWLRDHGFTVIPHKGGAAKDGTWPIEFSKVRPIDIEEIFEQT